MVPRFENLAFLASIYELLIGPNVGEIFTCPASSAMCCEMQYYAGR